MSPSRRGRVASAPPRGGRAGRSSHSATRITERRSAASFVTGSHDLREGVGEHAADLGQRGTQHREVRRNIAKHRMEPVAAHASIRGMCSRRSSSGRTPAICAVARKARPPRRDHVFAVEARHHLRYVDSSVGAGTSRSHFSKQHVLPLQDLGALVVDPGQPEIRPHPPSEAIEADVHRRQPLAPSPCRLGDHSAPLIVVRGSHRWRGSRFRSGNHTPRDAGFPSCCCTGAGKVETSMSGTRSQISGRGLPANNCARTRSRQSSSSYPLTPHPTANTSMWPRSVGRMAILPPFRAAASRSGRGHSN